MSCCSEAPGFLQSSFFLFFTLCMSFFLSVLADLLLPEEDSSLDNDDEEDDDKLELESRKADKLLFVFFSFFFIIFVPSKTRSPKNFKTVSSLSISLSLSLSESTILDKAGRQLRTSMSTRPAGAIMFSQRHRLFGVVAMML
jgi:hypothetical protein